MRTLAIDLDGKFQMRRGVPTVIVATEDMTYSVVYFADSQKFRVFSPYPAEPEDQERVDFRSREAVLSFFNVQT
jgi:hypothetical protein